MLPEIIFVSILGSPGADKSGRTKVNKVVQSMANENLQERFADYKKDLSDRCRPMSNNSFKFFFIFKNLIKFDSVSYFITQATCFHITRCVIPSH